MKIKLIGGPIPDDCTPDGFRYVPDDCRILWFNGINVRYEYLLDSSLGDTQTTIYRFIGAVESPNVTQQDPPVNAATQLLRQAIDVIEQRRKTYGPPAEHFARTATAVSAIFADKLREPLTAADWAQIMIMDKLARHQGDAPSDDTPIDLAGYAACLAECEMQPD